MLLLKLFDIIFELNYMFLQLIFLWMDSLAWLTVSEQTDTLSMASARSVGESAPLVSIPLNSGIFSHNYCKVM